jgi:hypothetical protein
MGGERIVGSPDDGVGHPLMADMDDGLGAVGKPPQVFFLKTA